MKPQFPQYTGGHMARSGSGSALPSPGKTKPHIVAARVNGLRKATGGILPKSSSVKR
jgi:hypothetical protein